MWALTSLCLFIRALPTLFWPVLRAFPLCLVMLLVERERERDTNTRINNYYQYILRSHKSLTLLLNVYIMLLEGA